MRWTGRRMRRRLIVAATLLAAAGGVSCDGSGQAAGNVVPPTPPSTAAPDPPGPVAITVGPRAPRPSAPTATTTTTTTTATTAAATTTTTRPEITDAQWRRFDDHLSVTLMANSDVAASWAVAIDGDLVHTGAIGARVAPPITVPALTVPSTTMAVAPGTATASTTSDAATATTMGSPSTTVSTPAVAAASGVPEEVDAGDAFRIASISKVLTATVVLQLVEAGELSLDEPVLGELAASLDITAVDPAVTQVTVRHLLSHTSGLGGYEGTFFGGRVASCAAAAGRGLSGGLFAPPGSAFRYSNMNFCLLGLLIEQATGQRYEDVVQERLLEPLGIDGMRLAGTFDPRPDEVQHASVPGRTYMESLGPAGGWLGSAADVVTILDALDPAKAGWHPLPDDVLRYMRLATDGIAYGNIAERWYGLGLIVWADGSWGHTGTVESAHAMGVNRPDGVTWSILVSGEYPSDTTRLQHIFETAAADADVRL